ncbi:MAG: hypothetical protein NT062_31240 [Proteobacteria bacterium]|nr:hypothetical protein [Pseudomonadota bacterium]
MATIDAIGEFTRSQPNLDVVETLRQIEHEPERKGTIDLIMVGHPAHADAMRRWSASVDARPTDFEVLDNACRYFVCTKNFPFAFELATRGATRDPDTARWTTTQGAIYQLAQLALSSLHVRAARGEPIPSGPRLDALLAVMDIACQLADRAGIEATANELLAAGETRPRALHHAHVALGWLALDDGQVTAAVAHLATAGLPAALNVPSFTPDFRLAQRLVATHRAEVTAFVEAVARWWTSDPSVLAGYRGDLAAGAMPRFR